MEDLALTVVVAAAVVASAFGLSYWAYRARDDRSARVGLYLLFGFPAALLVVAGLATLAAGDRPLATILLSIGLGFGLPLLGPVRRLLAAVTPMDPDSPVDMAGLSVMLAVLGVLGAANTIVQGAAPPDEVPVVGIGELVVQAVVFIALAYAAVGWWFVRSLPAATARLGISAPTWRTIGVGLGFTVLAFVLAGIVGLVIQVVQPELAGELDEVTEQITAEVQNPIGALILGASAGIGEEAVFRGALQPRYGIVLTSLAFALLHVQYGFNLTILLLFGVGVLFGLERRYFGTTAAMITHALYNAVQVLILTYA